LKQHFFFFFKLRIYLKLDNNKNDSQTTSKKSEGSTQASAYNEANMVSKINKLDKKKLQGPTRKRLMGKFRALFKKFTWT
jgi:type VI protein secretion system component Hcp